MKVSIDNLETFEAITIHFLGALSRGLGCAKGRPLLKRQLLLQHNNDAGRITVPTERQFSRLKVTYCKFMEWA